KGISRASTTGHATNIIEGLAIGMQATALPILVIAAGIVGAAGLAGLYGIGVAVMAQLSMTGMIVALDAYGPVTDNAGGMAETADLPEQLRGSRRDGGRGGGSAGRHRPARCGRQHDEGRHQGLCDRLGGPRGPRPL